jgi:glyoxylase-like metal-dependent hydrolase (beta-lactamase superfamily II)
MNGAEDGHWRRADHDDMAAANASVQRLEGLEVATVYPGHGKSFPFEAFHA